MKKNTACDVLLGATAELAARTQAMNAGLKQVFAIQESRIQPDALQSQLHRWSKVLHTTLHPRFGPDSGFSNWVVETKCYRSAVDHQIAAFRKAIEDTAAALFAAVEDRLPASFSASDTRARLRAVRLAFRLWILSLFRLIVRALSLIKQAIARAQFTLSFAVTLRHWLLRHGAHPPELALRAELVRVGWF